VGHFRLEDERGREGGLRLVNIRLIRDFFGSQRSIQLSQHHFLGLHRTLRYQPSSYRGFLTFTLCKCKSAGTSYLYIVRFTRRLDYTYVYSTYFTWGHARGSKWDARSIQYTTYNGKFTWGHARPSKWHAWSVQYTTSSSNDRAKIYQRPNKNFSCDHEHCNRILQLR